MCTTEILNVTHWIYIYLFFSTPQTAPAFVYVHLLYATYMHARNSQSWLEFFIELIIVTNYDVRSIDGGTPNGGGKRLFDES